MPCAVVTLCLPYLDLPFEAHARSFLRLFRGDEVVYAKWMRVFECLHEGKFRVRSVIYPDGAGARCRKKLSLGRRKGEDIGRVGVLDGVEGEVLLGLQAQLAYANA